MTQPMAWPYPSFAEPSWLGGERGPDRALAAVVRAVRTRLAEEHRHPDRTPEALLAGMTELVSLAERVDWALLSLVGEARAAGVTWAQVGAALGVSKQAAQQRFAPYVAEALARAGEEGGG